MPNQPGPNTVATSFTLPRDLLTAVNAKAKREMTNKSDIIRRALMNYLSPAEQAMVRHELAHAAEEPPDYPKKKS